MDQKEIKRFIFNLIIENETLENLDDAMLALFGLCTNQTEFEVVKHSLEKLVILSPRSLSRLISKFSQDIIEISKNCDKVAVVASAFDANPDGSQLLIQLLKSKIGNTDNKIKFFNSVPSFVKQDFVIQYTDYVLVDDFVGTGQSIEGRLKYIDENAKSKKVYMRANVIALAGMKNALINLKKLEIPVKFIYESTEGLSGYFKDERLQEFKDSMTRIELSLAQMVDGVQLPSLGYGKAEALFAVQDWNAPNSNFPVMWWPKYSDMSDRNTILRRSEL